MAYRFVVRVVFALVACMALVVPPITRAHEAAPAQPTVYPLTVIDDSGASVTFAAAPTRIVSLNPGHTETVFALGAGDRLVAVDAYSTYPAEAQAIATRLTSYPAPSIEAIVGLKPDLVLSLVEKDDLLGQLRQQGIPVLKLLPTDFDGTTQEIAELGRILDRSAQGAAIATRMRARRDAVAQAVATGPRPSVFYEMDASDATKPYTAGPGGFYGQLVDLAGGDNVFGDLPGDFAQVGAESVIARNPDLILLTDAYAPLNPQTPAMVAARPGWDQIAAVDNGAIYAVQAQLFSSPGPRLADGLESLAFLLHPDAFSARGPALSPAAAPSPFCAPGTSPGFLFGFAALAEVLGPTMGEPTECAHADATNGDTYQQTTKGLTRYRRATSTTVLTSGGGEHWALTEAGLAHWTGQGLDPPSGALSAP